MKKVVLAIFLGLALTALSVGPSQAAPAWFTCTVYSTGAFQAGPTTYCVAYLTDTAATPSFTQKLHPLSTYAQKELLATMLTAQANTKKVMAYIDGSWVYAAYAGDC
jgi:hypothetical protein